jgi:hypothetical protein
MVSICAVLLGVAAVMLACSVQAKPKKVSCDPNGTPNLVIGCIDNANLDIWEKLNRNYGRYLDSLYAKCQKDNPGGGSGGHEARATCVSKALEAEARRVNLEK